MSVDVYEVICKIVHLTVQTLSYVNRSTSGPLRPPSRSAELEVGRKWAGSASNQLTSGSLLGQPYFGSLRFTYGPLRPTSVPYPVVRSYVRILLIVFSGSHDCFFPEVLDRVRLRFQKRSFERVKPFSKSLADRGDQKNSEYPSQPGVNAE